MKIFNQSGRSMVEMLGVLAIIGVLSVGGIAGYNHAMFKYKLNRQREQISAILDGVTIHYEVLHNMPHTQYFILPILKSLDIIPNDMIKKDDDNYLSDIFGTTLLPYHNREDNGRAYYGLDVRLNKANWQICHNLFELAKLNSSLLWIVEFSKNTEETDTQWDHQIFGDQYCTAATRCLKNLSLSEIREMCSTCDNSLNRCQFFYLWDLQYEKD